MSIIDIRYSLNIKTENYTISSCRRKYNNYHIKIFLSKNDSRNNAREIVNEFLKYFDITPEYTFIEIDNREIDICATKRYIDDIISKIDSKFKKSYYIDDDEIESLYSITNAYDLYCVKKSSSYIEAYFIDYCLAKRRDFLDIIELSNMQITGQVILKKINNL